jgi:hypothetical protein
LLPSGSSLAEPRPGAVYRFVILPCDEPKMRWPGPEFELPTSSKALYRARSAARVESATVMQLNALDAVDDLAPDAGRVAGVAVARGTEALLSSDGVAALARWLAGPGFDDQVVRRCKRADAFGFRVVRKPTELAPEVTEVAVDLNCNSIGVVYQEGEKRLRSDAFFDASREALIAILNSAMPGAVRSSAR